MIPREVLRQVRRIEIRTRRLVNDVFGGEYHSVFKGRGMEFAEVREYVPGDDIRAIDWNVTARFGQPFIKIFAEERELTVILLVDISASGDFGTRGRLKADMAAEVAAVLAFSAVSNNDKVGLILFTDDVEQFVPPRKGKRHVLRVIREILYFKPRRRGTRISAALEHLARVQKRKAVVFLISDFETEGYERAFKLAGRRHDLVAIRIGDPHERALPNVGLVMMEDPETGRRQLVDTSARRVRARFAERRAERDAAFRQALKESQVEAIELTTNEPYARPLIQFFSGREKKR
ncbi:MAG: DUF58 domain-containing protein [Candidatus Eisenbacteria bacterium]|nr:DUF58 domain-containing protein [Candidatus Eisenbacteria bacterium]